MAVECIVSSILIPPCCDNQITKLEEVYAIKKYVPQLTYLDMSDNPLSDDKSYRWAREVWTVLMSEDNDSATIKSLGFCNYASPTYVTSSTHLLPAICGRPTVLRKLRSLEVFDQLEVTAAERTAFSDTAGGVTAQMIASGRWITAGGRGGSGVRLVSRFWGD